MNAHDECGLKAKPDLVFVSAAYRHRAGFQNTYQSYDEYKTSRVESRYGFMKTSLRISTASIERGRPICWATPYRFPFHVGHEALYWAQRYPDEVTAIIGLTYVLSPRRIDINMSLMRATALQGRLYAGFPVLPRVMPSGTGASEEEKDLYRCIFYRGTQTTAMLNETAAIKSNAEQVAAGEAVAVPVLLFASNGSGTGFDEDAWRGFQADFAQSVPDGQMISLDAPHYIHNYKYEEIAEHIRIFISELEK